MVDWRRVEDTYIQYAILKVCSWYPDKFSPCNSPFHHNMQTTLLDVTTIYHGEFLDAYDSYIYNYLVIL